MTARSFIDDYVDPLLTGNRIACRNFAKRHAEASRDPTMVYHELLWPAMERVDKLYRADRINAVSESMATRINRAIADQMQLYLKRAEPNGKRIVITSAPDESEELGGQMCADLFEARGWDVYFIGGGIPHDEILSLVGQLRPDILLIFGTQPNGVPAVRKLIDLIREIGVNPTMNILLSGGVFNRADALWKEVHADLFAKTAMQAIPIAEKAEPRKPEPPRTGAPKKRRRRRRPPLLATAGQD